MWYDFSSAIRTLRRSPAFSITVILTLSFGIGATALIFSIVNAVLLQALPFPESERLVVLWQRNAAKGLNRERVSPANFADWRETNRSFEHMGFYPAWGGAQTFRLVGNDAPERLPGAYASSGLFQALGVRPLLGRTFSEEEDERQGPQVAILSHTLWQRRFGGRGDILGLPVSIDTYGFRTYSIVGVMPPGFDFPEQSQIWLPAGWMGVEVPPPGSPGRCCSWLTVVARLKPAVTPEQARDEMNVIARAILERHPEYRESPEVNVAPLLTEMVGPARRPLLIILGAVIFVLLIACANVSNLMLSRSVARRQEIVMRAALGASRGRILLQSLIESLTLSLAGSAGGLAIVYSSLNLVVLAGRDRIPRLQEAAIDWRVLGVFLSLAVITAVMSGLAPALHASKIAVGGRQWAPNTGRIRNVLVISEIALATVLLIGAGLLIESFLRLDRVDPGFRSEKVLTAGFDMTGSSFAGRVRPRVFFHDLMSRIRSLPGVVAVGGASMLPLSDAGPASQSVTLQTRGILPAADSAKATLGGATPDYFRALGVPLLRGRFFTEDDDSGAPDVVIINETMARRYWPGENPIGSRVALGSREKSNRTRSGDLPWMEIVGVVADMRGVALDAEPRPEMYLPYWKWPWYEVALVVRTSGDPSILAASLRRTSSDLDRDALITRVRTMVDVVGDSIAAPRFRAGLLTIFSGSALLLAVFGTYSVVSYSVAQRSREIGVRMALGAQPGHVLRMIVMQGVRLAVAGVLIGMAAALAMGRVLSALLFEVRTTEPLVFGTVCFLLTGAAAAAVTVPAVRAARLDPMLVLRHE